MVRPKSTYTLHCVIVEEEEGEEERQWYLEAYVKVVVENWIQNLLKSKVVWRFLSDILSAAEAEDV